MRVLGIDPGTRVVGYACLNTACLNTAGLDTARLDTARLDTAERGPELPAAPAIKNLVRPRFKDGPRDGAQELGPVGTWKLGGRQCPLTERLAQLARSLRALIAEFGPDVLAVEAAFYGKSVSSALRLGEARGVILLVAAEAGLVIAEYPPALVKRRVTGHGSASKESVAATVAAQFGRGSSALSLDASDALAIALCHVHEQHGAAWRAALPG